jgi:hypothetical protein
LRRRANHRHKFSIAILIMSPRRETGRGLFQSDGGPHSGRTISSSRQASQSAPPSELFYKRQPARANVPAAAWPGATSARGPSRRSAVGIAPGGIGFAPEMAVSSGHAAQLNSRRKRSDMTAYLIALALAGLVAIAVWEGFS